MKKLKLITLMIVIVSFVISATACGSTNGTGKADEAASKDLPEVKLTFFSPGPADVKGLRNVLDEIEKKAKKELNIKLDFKLNGQSAEANYEKMLNESNASNEPADAFVYMNFSSSSTEQYHKLAKAGMLKDVTDLFPTYAPNYYSKFNPEDLAPAKVDNKLYVVPIFQPMTSRRCAIVNESIMKKYNIPEIKTSSDYETFLKTVKEKEPDYAPSIIWGTIPEYYSLLALNADTCDYTVLNLGLGLIYKRNDPDMKLMAWEQTPEYRNAVESFNLYKKSGYFVDVTTGVDMSKIASSLRYYSDGASVASGAPSNSGDNRMKVYPLDMDKKAQRAMDISGGIIINANSSNAERILMFIEWLQGNQENYDLLSYGIKDKNYVLYGDQLGKSSSIDFDDSYFSHWYGRNGFFNIERERTGVENPPDYYKKYLSDVYDNAEYPEHAGFYPELESVKDIASYRRLTYSKVEESIVKGEYKDNSIEEYIKDQKQHGVDRLVSVVQQQLDEWKKSNNK